MPITDREARSRLRTALREVSTEARLDEGNVRWVDGAYPGVHYGLILGQANALLFIPAEDAEGPGWEERLRERLTQAVAYLGQFPLSRVRWP